MASTFFQANSWRLPGDFVTVLSNSACEFVWPVSILSVTNFARLNFFLRMRRRRSLMDEHQLYMLQLLIPALHAPKLNCVTACNKSLLSVLSMHSAALSSLCLFQDHSQQWKCAMASYFFQCNRPKLTWAKVLYDFAVVVFPNVSFCGPAMQIPDPALEQMLLDITSIFFLESRREPYPTTLWNSQGLPETLTGCRQNEKTMSSKHQHIQTLK